MDDPPTYTDSEEQWQGRMTKAVDQIASKYPGSPAAESRPAPFAPRKARRADPGFDTDEEVRPRSRRTSRAPDMPELTYARQVKDLQRRRESALSAAAMLTGSAKARAEKEAAQIEESLEVLYSNAAAGNEARSRLATPSPGAVTGRVTGMGSGQESQTGRGQGQVHRVVPPGGGGGGGPGGNPGSQASTTDELSRGDRTYVDNTHDALARASPAHLGPL